MKPADLPVAHHTVKLKNLSMHYAELGTGPLVVLLHGFPENWWSWRHQLREIAALGFRVIAPDLRGYNDTDKAGPYDLTTLAEDVCQLIDAVQPGKARIVGHDWGGALAWHLAATRPEHTERLVVLNCPHPLKMREALVTKPSLKQLKKSWYMFMFQLPWLPERVLTRDDGGEVARSLKAMALDRTNFSDEDLRPFRDGVQKPGAASAMLGWYRTMMRDGLFGRPVKYAPIECETLLIWGMEDKALGFDDLVPGTERWAPKLKIAKVENCGHFVQSEQPAKVNAALLPFLRA